LLIYYRILSRKVPNQFLQQNVFEISDLAFEAEAIDLAINMLQEK
jgi:hypothetical protein